MIFVNGQHNKSRSFYWIRDYWSFRYKWHKSSCFAFFTNLL